MGGELGQMVSQADVNDNFEGHLGIRADGQVVRIRTLIEIILMPRCNRWFVIRLDGYWFTYRCLSCSSFQMTIVRRYGTRTHTHMHRNTHTHTYTHIHTHTHTCTETHRFTDCSQCSASSISPPCLPLRFLSRKPAALRDQFETEYKAVFLVRGLICVEQINGVWGPGTSRLLCLGKLYSWLK